MAFHTDLKAALLDQLGKDWVCFMPRWDVRRRVPWGHGTPDALMLHHTAAAATSSTSPANPGNLKGANDNVITYIQTHYEVPAANCTLDRDGTVYLHSCWPVWHAGIGSFRGKRPWSSLDIPDDMGNDYMAGVEIMSKGLRPDFTEAQKDSLVFLLRAWRDASGWPAANVLRRPRHRDWTSRKIDILYSQQDVTDWINQYGYAPHD